MELARVRENNPSSEAETALKKARQSPDFDNFSEIRASSEMG